MEHIRARALLVVDALKEIGRPATAVEIHEYVEARPHPDVWGHSLLGLRNELNDHSASGNNKSARERGGGCALLFEVVGVDHKRANLWWLTKTEEPQTADDLPPEHLEYNLEMRRRNQAHVRQLKELYLGRCQVTGHHILDGIAGDLTEAHHIHWLSEGGLDEPQNLIVVSPDIHAAVHAARGRLEWKKGQPVLIIHGKHMSLAINKHLKPPK